MHEKEIRFIDLFGGCGGFRLGLERGDGNRPTESQNQSGPRGDVNTRLGQEAESGSISDLWHPRSAASGKETPLYGGSTETQRRGNPSTNGDRPIFRCVWYADIDKYAVSVYNKNFKEDWKPTDIRTVSPESIPDFDLLCAGFPCQSFSVAGKRLGFQDTRGTLFFEIARITQVKRPRLLLLENVKGLLSHDEGRTFGTILATLDELGYDAEWEVLNSKHFGVPQNRERVFVVGHLRDYAWREVFPLGEGSEASPERRTQGNSTKVVRTIHAGGHSGGFHSDMTMVTTAIDSNYFRGIDNHGQRTAINSVDTDGYLRRPGHHYNLTSSRIRRLTPVECERLQGFPDDYTTGVSDTQRYKMMGNAVTVNVVQAIGERLLKLV